MKSDRNESLLFRELSNCTDIDAVISVIRGYVQDTCSERSFPFAGKRYFKSERRFNKSEKHEKEIR